MTNRLIWLISTFPIHRAVTGNGFTPRSAIPQPIQQCLKLPTKLFATTNTTIQKEESSKGHAEGTKDHPKTLTNIALHEIEHRAKHVGAVEGSKMITEKIVQSIEAAVGRAGERAGERVAERTGQRAAERVGERMAERAGERIAERAGERVAERAGERVAERAGERMVERAGERIAETTGKRIAETTGERLAERAGQRIAENAGERIAERAGERIAERAGERIAERTGERIAERTGERIAERAGERIAERTGERIAERAGERIAERAGELMAERVGERIIERSAGQTGKRVAERAGERAVERVGEHLSTLWRPVRQVWEGFAKSVGAHSLERAGEQGTERVLGAVTKQGTSAMERRALSAAGRRVILRRIGRGALIAVPVLGGLFGAHLMRSDIQRVQEERLRDKSSPAWLVFAGAALVDGIDALCHFIIAYALLTEVLSHHQLVLVESMSLFCALASVICAVGGEFLSIGSRRRQSNKGSVSG